MNCEYATLAKPSGAFVAGLNQVAKVIQRLKCADTVLARRLDGALAPMKSSRPKDKFKVLENCGIVTKDMVEAWGKLRNATAHATVQFDPDKMHEMFANCNTVYTMLNRLVFQAIGYSGKYQDFAALGWPIADFNTTTLPNPDA